MGGHNFATVYEEVTTGGLTEANLFRQVLSLVRPCASSPALTSGVTVSQPRTAALAGSLAVVAALALSACGAAPDNASTTADGKNAATATSASDFGGLDALVKAAKKEGTLHAIALPRDWANYGALIDGFTKKYGIKITVENPDGTSQD